MANWLNTRALGVSFDDMAVHIAELHRGTNGVRISAALSMALPREVSEDDIGALLRIQLQKYRMRGQSGGIALGRNDFFLRQMPITPSHSHPREPDETELTAYLQSTVSLPPDELVVDWLYSPHESANGDAANLLLAIARRRGIQSIDQIARTGELKLEAVEIRPVALTNAVTFAHPELRQGRLMLVHMEKAQFTTILLNNGEPIDAQTVVHEPGASDQPSMDAMLRTVAAVNFANSGFSAERLWISHCGQLDERTVRAAGESIALPCDGKVWHQSSRIENDVGDSSRLDDLAAATGVAIEMLEPSAPHFNLLLPWQARYRKRRRMPRTAVVIIAAAIVIISLATYVATIAQYRNQLQSLQQENRQMEPEVAMVRNLRGNWLHLSPWYWGTSPRPRLRYLDVIHEITHRFPSTDDAYLSMLTINDRPSLGEPNVFLFGQARDGRVPISFIGRLNESPYFQEATSGPLTDSPVNEEYRKSFSATCKFDRTAMPLPVSQADASTE